MEKRNYFTNVVIEVRLKKSAYRSRKVIISKKLSTKKQYILTFTKPDGFSYFRFSSSVPVQESLPINMDIIKDHSLLKSMLVTILYSDMARLGFRKTEDIFRILMVPHFFGLLIHGGMEQPRGPHGLQFLNYW